ncbi:MAG: two-component system, cell cycle response regulator [Acidobacteriota bacterium]|jgi:DNA-binding response OmpR family regulator|nr:two-component system, cell cycle response regulator [Acidobacteriota bacterium]
MPASTDIHAARILIVDDQPSNVRLLEHTLRRGGYTEVTSTGEPREVAALHLQNPFEIILLDLQMPHMSGFQVIEQLRAMEGGDRVAILVMSADPSLRLQSLQSGGSSFLSKPFVLADVLARVQLMLEKARAAAPAPQVRTVVVP